MGIPWWLAQAQGSLVEEEVEELSGHKVLPHPVYPLPTREYAREVSGRDARLFREAERADRERARGSVSVRVSAGELGDGRTGSWPEGLPRCYC